MNQQLIFTNHVAQKLDEIVAEIKPANVAVIVDSNVHDAVIPRMQEESETIRNATIVVVKPGEDHKTTDTLTEIWDKLTSAGVTRSSLLINMGGGVITDMGGFAASTFKRGIPFINIPTTLLGAIDASVGGKTGVNFNGLKNQIGAFAEAETVIVSSTFFKTLPDSELWSGYAEMIKHGLLASKTDFDSLLAYDLTDRNYDRMLTLMEQNVAVKSNIVAADPTEKGIRKALNLGHTAGHAFEELAMERHAPLSHGYAVIFGLLVELILSKNLLGFPETEVSRLAEYIKKHYGVFRITPDEYDRVIALMHQDKKNFTTDTINFTLLTDVGKTEINQTVSEDEIRRALDEYHELLK
ncbi:MAG: 3-dehydroquinate synthase [Muribaculaceae bacterium]|nr:3-dehydroquinate synthase [Muribaculaceae bacterium]